MVNTCSAYGCTNSCFSTHNGLRISFHTFPINNPLLLKHWLIKIRRANFKPTKYSKLCSQHFKAEDFVPDLKIRILKKDAVPSIFDYNRSKKDVKKTVPSTKTCHKRTDQVFGSDQTTALKEDLNPRTEILSTGEQVEPKSSLQDMSNCTLVDTVKKSHVVFKGKIFTIGLHRCKKLA